MDATNTPNGTFPSQHIRRLLTEGHIVDAATDALARVQPSSLDLTLSDECWQLPGSVLPHRGEEVRELVRTLGRRRIDLSKPTLLDRGKVYLIRLAQVLRLPGTVGAYTNNKSSTGRIDLATRTVCDRTPRYDKVPAGYHGEVWLEVIPKSFDVIVAAGVSLNQAIFYAQRTILRTHEMRELYLPEPSGRAPSGRLGRVGDGAESTGKVGTTTVAEAKTFSPLGQVRRRGPLLFDKLGYGIPAADVMMEDGLLMTLDLDQDVVGYQARKTHEAVDLLRIGEHDASEFFEVMTRPSKGQLWLERGRFYVFSTWEYIRVPPEYAVEMLPYDTSAGEFRAHYAGFFDPGFGYGLEGEELGTPAVLEVRAYEDDLIIRHRQPICRMAYESLSAAPDRLYHASIGSNYARQRGPKLSKFFRGA